MKQLLIASILLIGLLACENATGVFNNSESDSAKGTGNTIMPVPVRDMTITTENSYSDLFLDSTALEQYIKDKSLNDSVAQGIRHFYNARNYQFAWFNSEGFTEQGRGFWSLYDYANDQGNKASLQDKNLDIRMDTLAEVDTLHEWKNGFSANIIGINKAFEPLLNLPPKSFFISATKDGVLTTSEISLRLRYAFLEKFLNNTFNRISLGSPYPIGEIKLTKGISSIFESGYDYTKLSGGISHYKKLPPFGSIYYNVFAGKTFGTLPYMMLELAPGNEIYYYNKYAFNLMNRYQYVHDQYAGINFEHNIGNGIFRFVPLLKKLKFRQFYSARALRGTLTNANYNLNMPVGSPFMFESLNGKTYVEVGTGVDNILKLLRVDFIWLLAPHANFDKDTKRFGIFGSFRMAF